jgi:hypothetical protein
MTDLIKDNFIEICFIIGPIVIMSPYMLYTMWKRHVATQTLVETLSNETKSIINAVNGEVMFDSEKVYEFTNVQQSVTKALNVAEINYSYRDFLKQNEAFQNLLAKLTAIPPTYPFTNILLIVLVITFLILLYKIAKYIFND